MARQHREADLNVFLTLIVSWRKFVDVPVVHYRDRQNRDVLVCDPKS
jgi:hypothetical protein